MNFHTELHTWLATAWAGLFPEHPLSGNVAACPSPEHGDLTHPGAMLAAKGLRQAPIKLAQQLVKALPAHPWVTQVTAVAPGHLNITLNDAGVRALLDGIVDAGLHYGLPTPSGVNTIVEFVSANPTGPLHIGHARQAVIGDVLARLLQWQGATVHREFYYNDAGVQIDNLVASVSARYAEAFLGKTLVFEREHPDGVPALAANEQLFGKEWYHGDYIVELAHALHQAPNGATLSDADHMLATHPAVVARFAIAAMQAEQRKDLDAIGVRFDRFFSERSLHDSGAVVNVINRLAPFSYPKDGALWLKTTAFGDDKDRVMVKRDGHVTYFVPDVAYHLDKWERGFARAINVQGGDHHGTQARVKAGLAALGVNDPAFPTYLFHTMVKVIRNGVEVPTSKRSGGYVTLQELVADIGADAVRFLLLQRKADTDTTVDVDLAKRQSNDNPLYYVAYAHARACSLLNQVSVDRAGTTSGDPLTGDPAVFGQDGPEGVGAEIGWHASERALFALLAAWPGKVRVAADKLEPHRLTHDLHELAAAYHSTYHHGPRVRDLNAHEQAARLTLARAFRGVLQQGAALLGVHLPERMSALEAPEEPSSITTSVNPQGHRHGPH